MEDVTTSAVMAYESGYKQGVMDTVEEKYNLSAIDEAIQEIEEKTKDIAFNLVTDSHVDVHVVQLTGGCTIHLKIALTYGENSK